MNKKILVTYVSRAGSTAEVAEVIGKTLTTNGMQVDVSILAKQFQAALKEDYLLKVLAAGN